MFVGDGGGGGGEGGELEGRGWREVDRESTLFGGAL